MDHLQREWIIIPQNIEKTFYRGILFVKSKEFRVYIELKDKSKLAGANFRCDWELKDLLRGYENVLDKRLSLSSSLAEFLKEIHNLAERLLTIQERRVGEEHALLTPTYYAELIRQIEEIGWESLMYVDLTFSTLKLITRDSNSREHVLNIKLDSKYPTSKPSCYADLPIAFQLKWPSQDGSLKLIYEQFLQVLEQFQVFWDVLDDLGKNCWILEPETASKSCTFRRIALGNNSSLHIEINAAQPKAFPECRLLGADHVIVPLREKLNTNLDKWNENVSVLSNLETILEMKFPSQSSAENEDLSMDCGICYAYRLEDETPAKTCDDARCGQIFHISCLVEWLRALPNCRQSFNVIFGECPYCGKPLTVKLGKQNTR